MTLEILKPKRLKKGDTVGLISPASPYFFNSLLQRAVSSLESWGYRVKTGQYIDEKHGYLAGTDDQRAEDINAMFADDDIDAIIVTGGGYGSARLIERIDFQNIRKHPKIFVGFSDITSLHLAIGKYSGLVTFHGPGAKTFNPEMLSSYTESQMFEALTSDSPIGNIEKANENKWIQTFYPGKANGQITGGNLALVCASLGTPYEINTKGKILMLEDWNTEPWLMDHLFNHLYLSGKLNEVAGIVLGECFNCLPSSGNGMFMN